MDLLRTNSVEALCSKSAA